MKYLFHFGIFCLVATIIFDIQKGGKMELLLTVLMCMLVTVLTFGAQYIAHKPTKRNKQGNTIDPTF